MPHDPKHLENILRAAAPLDVPLAFRPMFGGIMAYADGRVFASLSDVGLALKFGRQDHAIFAAVPGCTGLRYAPDDPPSKTYLLVPESLLTDAATLATWTARSIASLPKKL